MLPHDGHLLMEWVRNREFSSFSDVDDGGALPGLQCLVGGLLRCVLGLIGNAGHDDLVLGRVQGVGGGPGGVPR